MVMGRISSPCFAEDLWAGPCPARGGLWGADPAANLCCPSSVQLVVEESVSLTTEAAHL